eukprot:scaffold2331_cov252-Pinguiococcus_pyrenoidosus.AAC.8
MAFLRNGVCVALLVASAAAQEDRFSKWNADFNFGIASGDATTSSVILWTHVTPRQEQPGGKNKVKFTLCPFECNCDRGDLRRCNERCPTTLENPSGSLRRRLEREQLPCIEGNAFAFEADGYTLKVDITGLPSNSKFVYQFKAGSIQSPVGVTRTLPAVTDDVSELNYAFFSCSNYRFGYFHAYELAAQAEQLDFVLHLGDSMYEYNEETYPSNAQAARQDTLFPENNREILFLEEYRKRQALYKSDAQYQKLLRRVPIYINWDDHELVNDATREGTADHVAVCPGLKEFKEENGYLPEEDVPIDVLQAAGWFNGRSCDRDEGDYNARLQVAAQAFHEWNPIRTRDPGNLLDVGYQFHYGKLASFASYETRVGNRDTPGRPNLFTDTSFIGGVILAFDYDDWPGAAQCTAQVVVGGNQAAVEMSGARQIGEASVMSMLHFFNESKTLGIPFQVYASATIMDEQKFVFYRKAREDFDADVSGLVDPLTGQTVTEERKTQIKNASIDLFENPLILAQRAKISDPTFTNFLLAGSGEFDAPWNPDSWDGYWPEREEILEIFDNFTNNAIVLAGDSHNAFSSVLRRDDKASGDGVGVTLDGPSVSSPGTAEAAAGAGLVSSVDPASSFDGLEYCYLKANEPNMVYTNLKDRGFVLNKVTPSAYHAEYIFYNTFGPLAPIFSLAASLRDPTFYTSGGYCDAYLMVDASTRGGFSVVDWEPFLNVRDCTFANFDEQFYQDAKAVQEELLGPKAALRDAVKGAVTQGRLNVGRQIPLIPGGLAFMFASYSKQHPLMALQGSKVYWY